LRSADARQVLTGCDDHMLASQTKNPVSAPARSAMPSKSTDQDLRLRLVDSQKILGMTHLDTG
jgi:hypothetical protein